MSVSIKPIGDKIVVKTIEAQTTTASGLVIPESAQELPTTGIVIAVGQGTLSTFTGSWIPLEVNNGDTVVFAKYAGTKFEIEGEEYHIMRENDILAVITNVA